MNAFLSPSQIHLNRLLSKSLIVGVFSTAALIFGLAPSLSGRAPALVFSTAAIAQTINDQEVTSYAKIVLELEPVRQDAMDKIQKINGSASIPAIVCNDENSINALPRKVREIAVNFCNESKAIVERNGLNIARFNAITVSLQNNPNLEQRIKQEMVRLQKRPGS